MQVTVKRHNLYFKPDSSRVVARFFNNGDARTTNLVHRIMNLNETEIHTELQNTLKASGCYNDKIELAYFNAESIKLGYKPAEFTAMCMIAK